MAEKGFAKILVTKSAESEKSWYIGTTLILKENGDFNTATGFNWYPKSICKLTQTDKHFLYYLEAPKWLLDKNNVKYEL
jgi:hypothetical protein